MEKLIVPLGIVTYSLVLLTAISGKMGVKINFHRLLAGLTILLATGHAFLVLRLVLSGR